MVYTLATLANLGLPNQVWCQDAVELVEDISPRVYATIKSYDVVITPMGDVEH